MCLNYKEASELVRQFDAGEIKPTWLVYGRVGTGKTHFASTFPDPFFICTDAQVLGLKTVGSAGYIEIASIDDLMAVLADAEQKRAIFVGDRIKTLVLDGLTECTDLAIQQVSKDGKMNLQLWGYASDRIRMLLRIMISLRTKYQVVVTAKATILQDSEQGLTVGVPDTIGKLQHVVGGMFNVVVYATQQTKYDPITKKWKAVYELHTTEHERYPAVDRTGKLDVVEPNDYRIIVDKLYGGAAK